MPPETRYAQSGDVQIAYQVLGDGPIDLVFVPGFVWHVEAMWSERKMADFFERLASFTRLILFDKRGQGMSDRPAAPPTLEDGMDDARAVMDAAGSERAALFGISEGGPMAILFAATHPDRTTSLIIFGSYPRVTSVPGYASGITDESLDEFLTRLTSSWGDPSWLKVWAPSMAGDPEIQRLWSRMLRLGTSPGGARSLLHMYRDLDVRDVLPTISVPALVVHARGDKIAPVVGGRTIADGIPGARYLELDGDDHLVLPYAGELLGEIEEHLTGARTHEDPDRVLATVLFTDIVNSTDRAAELGDRRWRDLVGRHDELVRREVESRRGRWIKSMGDGVLATFDGPARGIRAAEAIVDGVKQLGVEVRAGLHTGECELVGDDVSGLAVAIGARVSALAGPGEVLVSSTVKDLVVGSGLEFEDRGPRSLKGVPGDWRLYAVS